ncbi:thioredoxin [Actinobacillus succinogenes]|uniref:Alkyl hydroperoxide reductase/ Thiol specific antioxidant/ Mal allergen n=1 Tax=Actinobacillus succinogenes (strain ATCC 55618 / DSM 22257 / CCUG 43843 / 130Z) TaxID=339671 RepID=A6VPX4_ACTSZ|nr:TlpA disulfide reductase family protein [Actinobacillus succinogenes]ABR75021.1 alkyl hydroperoxide reductase/ Thiol specific antioxidant/ Mal allergen [Actinobacillus succinogenes 130Z]PHI40572.1 thioredoxin [Actinobacillus succinogenes]
MRIKSLFPVLSAVVFSAILFGCKEQTAEIGKQAPDIAVFDLQGNKTELNQFHGKTLLMSFWSGNCGVCVAELKSLEKMAAEYPDKVEILAINIDGENADTQAVVIKQKIGLPVLKDQMKITGERYGVTGTPTSFVISPEGNIQAKYEGLIPEQTLQKLFKG